jgi:hypothetical protein
MIYLYFLYGEPMRNSRFVTQTRERFTPKCSQISRMWHVIASTFRDVTMDHTDKE